MTTLNEPLRPAEVKRLLLAILDDGEVSFTNHALDEMEQDKISQAEAIGALRSGGWSLPNSSEARGGTGFARSARMSSPRFGLTSPRSS